MFSHGLRLILIELSKKEKKNLRIGTNENTNVHPVNYSLRGGHFILRFTVMNNNNAMLCFVLFTLGIAVGSFIQKDVKKLDCDKLGYFRIGEQVYSCKEIKNASDIDSDDDGSTGSVSGNSQVAVVSM